MPARKKPFVVDYRIDGTLYIDAPNPGAAQARATAIVRDLVKTADESGFSGYCEELVDPAIDVEGRIARQRPAPTRSII